jgi:hypothetical protein
MAGGLTGQHEAAEFARSGMIRESSEASVLADAARRRGYPDFTNSTLILRFWLADGADKWLKSLGEA